MPLRPILCLLSLLLLLGTPASAAGNVTDYRTISGAALEARLNAGEPTHIVDIQVEEEFARHHIKGAVPTHAYPVKSDADRAKLDAVVEELRADADPVVIVCPRGGGGARRTYDYLLARGIGEQRLLILEKGQEGWACAPLTETR